jgi:hypothetical protein
MRMLTQKENLAFGMAFSFKKFLIFPGWKTQMNTFIWLKESDLPQAWQSHCQQKVENKRPFLEQSNPPFVSCRTGEYVLFEKHSSQEQNIRPNRDSLMAMYFTTIMVLRIRAYGILKNVRVKLQAICRGRN